MSHVSVTDNHPIAWHVTYLYNVITTEEQMMSLLTRDLSVQRYHDRRTNDVTPDTWLICTTLSRQKNKWCHSWHVTYLYNVITTEEQMMSLLIRDLSVQRYHDRRTNDVTPDTWLISTTPSRQKNKWRHFLTRDISLQPITTEEQMSSFLTRDLYLQPITTEEQMTSLLTRDLSLQRSRQKKKWRHSWHVTYLYNPSRQNKKWRHSWYVTYLYNAITTE